MSSWKKNSSYVFQGSKTRLSVHFGCCYYIHIEWLQTCTISTDHVLFSKKNSFVEQQWNARIYNTIYKWYHVQSLVIFSLFIYDFQSQGTLFLYSPFHNWIQIILSHYHPNYNLDHKNYCLIKVLFTHKHKLSQTLHYCCPSTRYLCGYFVFPFSIQEHMPTFQRGQY